MLSFRNIFKKGLRDLKLLMFYDCRFKNLNTGSRNPFQLNSSVIYFNSFSTENTAERFPLCEIGTFNINQLNCDLIKWHGIVDEILKHKAAGKKLPEYLSMENLTELVKCDTKTQRFKYLTFLFKKEKKKLNDAEKQLRKKAERAASNTKNVQSKDHIQYGLGKNTLVLRARNHKFYDKRLANSILFGQKIVIDLSYDEFMWNKEKRDCAAQIAVLYGANKRNRYPYNLYICNAKSETQCVKYLRHVIPNIDDSLVTLTEQSYLELFPKENLVYLSPHATDPLKTYDHKAIYIIGGFVDTVKRNDISSLKSQEEGIKSYYLPLDEYVLWGCGSRSLSINQVFSIMQTMRDTGDWRQAFKHIPTRKLRRLKADSEEAQQQFSSKCVRVNA